MPRPPAILIFAALPRAPQCPALGPTGNVRCRAAAGRGRHTFEPIPTAAVEPGPARPAPAAAMPPSLPLPAAAPAGRHCARGDSAARHGLIKIRASRGPLVARPASKGKLRQRRAQPPRAGRQVRGPRPRRLLGVAPIPLPSPARASRRPMGLAGAPIRRMPRPGDPSWQWSPCARRGPPCTLSGRQTRLRERSAGRPDSIQAQGRGWDHCAMHQALTLHDST